MNQRSTNGRIKDQRRHITTRKDEQLDEPRRSSTERSRPNDKFRSRSRDGQNNLVFRSRQEFSRYYKTPENSPCRLSHSDTLKSEGMSRTNGLGSKDFQSRRNGRSIHGTSNYTRCFHGRSSQDSSQGHSDDSRLLRLLQRLEREDDRERQLTTLKQLKEFFMQLETTKVVSTNLSHIISVLEDFLHHRLHTEVKQELAPCLGMMAVMLGTDSKNFFEWIFSTYNNSSNNHDLRILLMKTITEALKQDENGKLSEMIPMIMTNSQSSLENADSSDLLIAIVDVVLQISSTYPSIFSNNFRDTVDIIIGWHIDSSQTNSFIKYTSKALVSFHQFWIADLKFSLNLLGQFLEDMEAYAEDVTAINYNLNEELASTASSFLAKINCLIRVFTTVLKSLGKHATPAEGSGNSLVTWKFLTDSLKSLLKCIIMTTEYAFSENLLTSANKCVCLLMQHAQSNSVDAVEQLTSYIALVQKHIVDVTSEAYILSFLQLLLSFVKELCSCLPIEMVENIFSSSLFQNLRLSPNSKIQSAYLNLQHAVLGLKNVPVLEKAYKCILSEIKITASIIFEADCDLPVEDHKFKNQTKYSPEQAEIIFLSNLCALAEIGNAKHSIIGMWALKPSFFDLIVNHLQPESYHLAVNYPSLQYALLYILYSHSARHAHFISSSSLISQNLSQNSSFHSPGHTSPILASVSVISPPSSSHLSRSLKILSSLFKLKETPFDSKLLAIRWSQEIFLSIQQHLPRLCRLPEIKEMIESVIYLAYTTDSVLTRTCCSVLQTLVKSSASSLSDKLLKRCFEVCILKLSDHDPEIQEDFSTFLTYLPLHIVSSQFPYTIARLGLGNNVKLEQSSMDDSVVTIPDIWLARRGHMNRSPLGTFHSHNFRTVMAYILQGTEPKDKDWLLRLFYTSQHVDKQSKLSDMLMTLMVSSTSLLWFWTTFEVAQMCVLNKLRTPLGKPQETFMTIEAAIKSYAKQVGKQDNLKPNHRRNSDHDLLRVRLLLDIMEHLEKLMYNAYEGCALMLSTPPKTVRTFFRTNKGTCLEWLSRVRTAILVVSLQSGQLAVAVRQGYQLLQEMSESGNTQGTEFEQVLMYVIQALIGLQCPEAILGLYNWCKELHGRKFTWIKAAVDQATGRFETSAFEYICILYSLNQTVPSLTSSVENIDVTQDEEENDFENELSNQKNSLSDEDVVSKAFQQLELKDMSETKPDNDMHLQSFLMEQIIDCYRNIGSWNEALKWTEMERKIRWSKNGMMVHHIFSDSDLTFLKTLSVFDDGVKSQFSGTAKSSLDFSAVSKFGGSLDSVCWERKRQLRSAESTLLTACVEYESIAKPIAEDMKYVIEEMKKSRDQILRMMKISVLEWPPFIEPVDASLYLGAVALLSSVQKGRKVSPATIYDNLKLSPPDYSSSFLSHVLSWNTVNLHVASKEQGIRPQLGTLSELQLIAARLARKQQNYKLAQKLLLRNTSLIVGQNLHINMKTGTYSTDCLSATHLSDTDYLLENLRSTMLITPSEKLAKLQIEGAKLLHSWGDTRGAAEVLINSVYAVTQALNDSNEKLQFGDEPLRQFNARSLLTLVKYLQQDMKQLNDLLRYNEYSKNCPTLQKLFNVPINGACFGGTIGSDLENKDCFSDLKLNAIMNEPEFSLGKLLQCAVTQCPNLGKAWASLASWYYRWGRKATDMTSDGCIELTTEEKQHVLNALSWDWNEEEKDSILQVISQIHASSENEWDDHGMDAFGDRADLIRRQLLASCPNLQNANDGDQVVENLVEVWRKVLRRVYRYYELSAKAYFQFIHLNSECEENERCEDDNVTATLRLLRLVVKHAAELRDVLEKGLAKTPTAPWRGIIPQLFSRLNHPEPYVRQSISDLLCRVAQASPHLIVFPAVVGSLTIKKGSGIQEEPASGIFATCFSQTLDESAAIPDLDHHSPDLTSTSSPLLSDDDESEEEQQKAAIMQNCFTALVETLARQDAHTIAEVKNLVHELRRITLLWDELWLGTLNLHHAEVNRRIQTLEEEIKKVQSNSSLARTEKFDIIREKHAVFMRPTMFVLEQLQSISSQSPETPHEQWFQDTFGKHIEDILLKFRNPLDPSRPQQTWALYKQLHQMLQQRIHQQTRSHLLMEQISPVLSSLQSTRIPMPGINTKSVHVITIDSVHNNVSILPTKTKPKKLAFIGSDGDKYTYLFKGLEDLHLDERIMQFLSIVNNMFMKNKRHGKVVYLARHYSVTPLGPRSGLIQWVDGATPLFGLYKRWQQREATAQALKNQGTQSGNIGVPPSILRPSEIYYNSLTPLLKEKGITNLENRKEWPLSVLIQTLQELMVETPKDLLAKELWCCCSTALEWWELTQTYNHSTAVMSMIGYIIGLGDRHLDNVLVDLSTGEVVHIDYNVCFEKGKNLRVPEKVPFRMTPNIETALGVTGIEGIFRVSCEHVLKVLRKGREPLLTLLEAFVYDPLVDWTPGSEGGYTGAVYGGRQTRITESRQSKQEMELEVAYSMLSIRVAEMKHDWLKNRDELLSSIPKLKTHLQEWHAAQVELQSTEAQLPEICQQRALLEEAQTNPNHTLFSLPKRFDEHAVVKATIASSKDAVKEKLAECKKWQNHHSESLRSVCGADLGKWCSEVATNININSLSIAPVVEFLQTAGQGQLVQQCEHAETDLGTMLQQQQIALTNCVELLRTYATIVLQYPPEFKEQNRSFQWQCWLDNLLNDFNLEKCQEVITEFHNKYGIESMNIASIQAAIGLHYQLQSLVTDVNTKLVNVLERQHIEGLDDLSPLSAYVREAKSAIQHFVEENGDQGKISVECVIVTALCALNRRLLLMDNAAAAAGDCLVDLTSWGGDWYLDEMYSMSNSMIQLITILQEFIEDETGDVKAALHAVNSAHCVFTGLEDLSLNFQNIILPEAVKTVQSEDPSVLDMISKLTKIITNAGSPLDTLVAELEADMRNIIMEIQTPDNNAMEVIENMKKSFDLLMKGEEPEISDLTPGQMLLMGFNGLFTKLESDMSDLLLALNHLSPPLIWRKVDLVREAAAFMPPIHLASTRTILCDIFFLKRLQAIQQFFTLCREFSLSLRIPSVLCNSEREGTVPLLTDEQLFKPVKLFIAEYVRKQVLGLPSQTVAYALCILILTLGIDVTAEIELRDIGAESKVSLEELSKKAVDLCMKQEKFQAAQLTQASTLISSFDSSWRKEDLARRLDQSVLFLKASLQRAQLQLARHQWLNEDLLVQGNIGPLQNLAVPTRASVMSEMRKTVQALLSLESAISIGQERYLGFTASVEQRLKWAAGANPSLVTIQEEFETSIAEKTSSVTTFTQLSRELGNVCNAILHFEALRTRTNEALSSDTTFLSLINRCQESCLLQENCSSQVTLIEEQLLNLKPLSDGGVTQEWISTLMEKVSQLLASCKEKLEEKKMESYVQWDIVKSQVVAIRTLLSTHHRHMSDIRNILRTLAKYEEQDFQIEEKQEGRLHRYITTYRIFSEQISGMVREVLSEGQDLECSHVEKIISKLDPLESMTQEVYDELLNLAGPMGKCRMGNDNSKRVGHPCQNVDKDMKSTESKKHNLSTMQGQELLSAASPVSEGVPQKCLHTGSSKKNSVMRDPRTGKIIQERNTYATNVWRRVKMKLDGRDPDPNKRSTIAEQVDFVIKEATNLENLAVLYEGWTPWV